jgi:hypothetical protein
VNEHDDVKVRVRRLSADKVDTLRAGIAPRLLNFQRRWEKSRHTDTKALHGALLFYKRQLPDWLFEGLCQRLEGQQRPEDPPYHRTRWFMVTQELVFDSKLQVREACALASKRLAHTPARGSAGTMERSYYLIEARRPRSAKAKPT